MEAQTKRDRLAKLMFKYMDKTYWFGKTNYPLPWDHASEFIKERAYSQANAVLKLLETE